MLRARVIARKTCAFSPQCLSDFTQSFVAKSVAQRIRQRTPLGGKVFAIDDTVDEEFSIKQKKKEEEYILDFTQVDRVQ